MKEKISLIPMIAEISSCEKEMKKVSNIDACFFQVSIFHGVDSHYE